MPQKLTLPKIIIFLLLVIIVVLGYKNLTAKTDTNQVIIYVSHDQDYSEPILKDFEAQTGIKVKAVYDTEATKTTGLVNRLIAEKDNPQADVFWNNEVSRTIVLKREGVLEPYISPNAADIPNLHKDAQGYWTGFAARARVLLVNTDLVEEAPETLEELTDSQWKDNVTLANPLFGTTASHATALFVLWGDKKAEQYFADLKENGLVIAESNGQTRDMVADSEIMVGFTDTDDANDAISDGKPVKVIYPDQGKGQMGTLIIPNSVMLVKDASHPENAKKLIDYLLTPDVEEALAFSKAAQMPLHPNVSRPENVPDVSEIHAMSVSWEEVAEKLPAALEFLQELFLR
ncbi:MAG: extracellular solute-binding protein [Candidatus Cloacimonetes bacterium]|nr:extracellular solute-binding protein [Candidatus Cloacimonadota bacterium]